MSQPALRRSAPPGATPAPWGCDWCGQQPAYDTVVTPAQYTDKRLVRAARHAICCVPCAAHLRLDLAGCRPNTEQVALHQLLAASKRAERRQAMAKAQQQLF